MERVERVDEAFLQTKGRDNSRSIKFFHTSISDRRYQVLIQSTPELVSYDG